MKTAAYRFLLGAVAGGWVAAGAEGDETTK